MPYKPQSPLNDWTNLTIGLILLIASSATIAKINQGSKSAFAYTLMGFSFASAMISIIGFFTDAYRYKIVVNGKDYYVYHFNVFMTFYFAYYPLSLQGWFFAMKYLDSSVTGSLDSNPCLSQRFIRVTLWLVAASYSILIATVYLWTLISMPGFVNENSLD